MKYFVRFFVVTFCLLICTQAKAEQKIVYIDMKLILNTSNAGKGAQDFLKKSFTDKQKQFVQQEKELKKEETDLLSKKATLSKEDYTKKSDTLRKKVIDYQSARRSALDAIAKQRAEAREKLLKNIEPILQTYMDENTISLVVDKQTILKGSTNLDITNIIIEKLNKELPSLNLK